MDGGRLTCCRRMYIFGDWRRARCRTRCNPCEIDMVSFVLFLCTEMLDGDKMWFLRTVQSKRDKEEGGEPGPSADMTCVGVDQVRGECCWLFGHF